MFLFPVGEPALFHTHSNDNVSIELSGDKTKSQPWSDKGPWRMERTGRRLCPGAWDFTKLRASPTRIALGSAGEKPYHVIDVEIFP